MDYRNKKTGTIFHVTNENIIPQYDGNENFEKVVAEVVPATSKKKPSAKVKKAEEE